ncbi:uncharacterized protein METZ01_LOCUS134760 [marine metagenome]|uniref:Uncharacterized protein n=1 Tax=marine metagenome TaxID=408172 RepID=A0A381YXW4_9ZZZZ
MGGDDSEFNFPDSSLDSLLTLGFFELVTEKTFCITLGLKTFKRVYHLIPQTLVEITCNSGRKQLIPSVSWQFK